MAPIDPYQLLVAFDGYLSPKGGIKSVDMVPKIVALMRKFSKKLVSRCVYINLLTKTNDDVLEVVLEQGGWDTINLWLKKALESNNQSLVFEVVKLLGKCPVTVERMKLNDTPRLVKSLLKSESQQIAIQSQVLVQFWKRLITGEKEQKSTQGSALDENSDKKRKKKESYEKTSASEEVSAESRIKKLKSEGYDKWRIGPNSGSLSDSDAKPEARPSTAKLRWKENKKSADFLADLRASTNATSDATVHKKTLPVVSSCASDLSASSLMSTLIGNLKNSDITPVRPPGTGEQMLRESTSFIDSIADTSQQFIRRRKPIVPKRLGDGFSGIEDKASNVTSGVEEQIEAQMRGVSMEYVEEAVSEEPTREDVEDISDTFSCLPASEGGPVASTPTASTPYKSILILSRNTSSLKKKKSVKWVADESMNQIKVFDLDVNERVNVTKVPRTSGISDNKAEGLSLIAHKDGEEALSSAAIPPIEYMRWQLTPVSDPLNLFTSKVVSVSKEKDIQRQRLELIVPVIYPSKALIPDSPLEPDVCAVPPTGREAPLIPLDDLKNPGHITDYSLRQFPSPKSTASSPP